MELENREIQDWFCKRFGFLDFKLTRGLGLIWRMGLWNIDCLGLLIFKMI